MLHKTTFCLRTDQCPGRNRRPPSRRRASLPRSRCSTWCSSPRWRSASSPLPRSRSRFRAMRRTSMTRCWRRRAGMEFMRYNMGIIVVPTDYDRCTAPSHRRWPAGGESQRHQQPERRRRSANTGSEIDIPANASHVVTLPGGQSFRCTITQSIELMVVTVTGFSRDGKRLARSSSFSIKRPPRPARSSTTALSPGERS